MSKTAMPVPEASRKTKVTLSPDESYDRYKRPSLRWQPILLVCAAATLLLAWLKNEDLYRPDHLFISMIPTSMLSLDQRVDRIMSLTPLIDGHDDLAEKVHAHFQNHIYSSQFKSAFENGSMPDHLDLPRMRAGKQGGFFWSCWVDCPKKKFDFSNENYAPVVIEALAQMDVILRLQSTYSDLFSPATLDSTSALSAFKRRGKRIAPIGLEGLHMVGRNASTLRLYKRLGVHYVTLTWNCHNAAADATQVAFTNDPLDPESVRPAKPHWGGLSLLGTQMVHEMNRLGIMVDLSHTHPATMHDVLAGNATKSFPGSLAPVIFSHSSAHALCPHPRNVPDHILPLVARTNSVIMVTFVPQFISCTAPPDPSTQLPAFYPENNTLAQVADHIMYIGRKIGFEHVGVGSDFDGIPSTPRGLEDVSKFPDLVRELLSRGVTDDQARGIVGGNLLRVWKKVEDMAAHMQRQGALPMEDDLS